MKRFNAYDQPIEVRGLLENFMRLPTEILDPEKVNDGVITTAPHTSGGRVRFASNARELSFSYKLKDKTALPHMPLSGISGVDIYIDGKLCRNMRPEGADILDVSTSDESIICDGNWHEFECFLPIYNGISEFCVEINDEASVKTARPYTYEKPVVFYGSSITHGLCASRPSLSYPAVVSRNIDCDFINLGFCGSARGEQAMAEYIASIEMTAFVLDYDYNSSLEELKERHLPFYQTVRRAQPDLPIILMSKPDFDSNPPINTLKRRVVMETYLAALDASDKNTYFCDGKSLFGNFGRDDCTTDRFHPNDLGFRFMADTVTRDLKFALNISR